MMRFEKKDHPVIFIGLGGTGKEMVRAIKRKFEELFELETTTNKPRRTAYMVIDGESCATTEFGQDYIDITVPYPTIPMLNENPDLLTNAERSWYTLDYPMSIPYSFGAVRQVERLKFFRHFDEIKNHFRALAMSISRAVSGTNQSRFDIVICAGLAGGTGSGILVDMGYLASEWIGHLLPGYSTKTYGFFTMPDLHAYGGGMDERINANAYAALKELDYLQNVANPESREKYIQLYPDGSQIDWCEDRAGGYRHPYDNVFLLSGRYENGIPLPGDAKAEIYNKVAEMMLSCYAEENTAGNGNVGFSFDAFMSGVAAGLRKLNQNAPVNKFFASLGFGSSNVVEEYIQQYETEAVLEEVLTVPLFDHDGNAAVAGHKAVYAKDAQGIPQLTYTPGSDGANTFLALEENRRAFLKDVFAPDDAFFNPEKILEAEDREFAEICRYIPRHLDFEILRDVQTENVRNHIDLFVGSEGGQGWRYQAWKLAADMANRQWTNFVVAAKKAIQQLNIGTVALADYLEQAFVPQLDELVQKWQKRSVESGIDFEEQTRVIPDMIQKGLYPDNIMGTLGKTLGTPLLSNHQKAQLVDHVSNAWGRAGAARRSSIFAEARYNSMRTFVQKVKDYLNNLIALNDALLSIQEEAGAKLDAAAATPNPHALVSAGQIKNYFDNVADRERAVAQARGSILAQLAQTSFSLAAPPKNADYEQLQQYNETLIGAIGQFITRVHDDMNMGSLDWIIDVNPAVAVGSVQDKISYVERCLAPSLDCMAAPTLAVRTTIETVDYKAVGVPYNAPVLLQGYRNYARPGAAGGYCTVMESEITDRVAQMKVRIGFALEDILGIDRLREDFHRRDCERNEGIRILGENTDYIYKTEEEV